MASTIDGYYIVQENCMCVCTCFFFYFFHWEWKRTNANTLAYTSCLNYITQIRLSNFANVKRWIKKNETFSFHLSKICMAWILCQNSIWFSHASKQQRIEKKNRRNEWNCWIQPKTNHRNLIFINFFFLFKILFFTLIHTLPSVTCKLWLDLDHRLRCNVISCSYYYYCHFRLPYDVVSTTMVKSAYRQRELLDLVLIPTMRYANRYHAVHLLHQTIDRTMIDHHVFVVPTIQHYT